MWKIHAAVLLALCVATLPVAWMDRSLLAPTGGGDWISLDFRGLLIQAYVLWVLIHAALTTVALASGTSRNLLVIHGVGGVLSVIAFVGVVVVYQWVRGRSDTADAERSAMEAEKFSDATKVERWAVDSASDPVEVKINLVCAQAGDVAIEVSGLNAGGVTVVQGSVERTTVREGDKPELHVHLKRWGAGSVVSWQLQLMFFKSNTDISTIFESKTPFQIYDGFFVHRQLPPRSAF